MRAPAFTGHCRCTAAETSSTVRRNYALVVVRPGGGGVEAEAERAREKTPSPRRKARETVAGCVRRSHVVVLVRARPMSRSPPLTL